MSKLKLEYKIGNNSIVNENLAGASTDLLPVPVVLLSSTKEGAYSSILAPEPGANDLRACINQNNPDYDDMIYEDFAILVQAASKIKEQYNTTKQKAAGRDFKLPISICSTAGGHYYGATIDNDGNISMSNSISGEIDKTARMPLAILSQLIVDDALLQKCAEATNLQAIDKDLTTEQKENIRAKNAIKKQEAIAKAKELTKKTHENFTTYDAKIKQVKGLRQFMGASCSETSILNTLISDGVETYIQHSNSIQLKLLQNIIKNKGLSLCRPDGTEAKCCRSFPEIREALANGMELSPEGAIDLRCASMLSRIHESAQAEGLGVEGALQIEDEIYTGTINDLAIHLGIVAHDFKGSEQELTDVLNVLCRGENKELNTQIQQRSQVQFDNTKDKIQNYSKVVNAFNDFQKNGLEETLKKAQALQKEFKNKYHDQYYIDHITQASNMAIEKCPLDGKKEIESIITKLNTAQQNKKTSQLDEGAYITELVLISNQTVQDSKRWANITEETKKIVVEELSQAIRKAENGAYANLTFKQSQKVLNDSTILSLEDMQKQKAVVPQQKAQQQQPKQPTIQELQETLDTVKFLMTDDKTSAKALFVEAKKMFDTLTSNEQQPFKSNMDSCAKSLNLNNANTNKNNDFDHDFAEVLGMIEAQKGESEIQTKVQELENKYKDDREHTELIQESQFLSEYLSKYANTPAPQHQNTPQQFANLNTNQPQPRRSSQFPPIADTSLDEKMAQILQTVYTNEQSDPKVAAQAVKQFFIENKGHPQLNKDCALAAYKKGKGANKAICKAIEEGFQSLSQQNNKQETKKKNFLGF